MFLFEDHHTQSERVLALLKSKPVVPLTDLLALRPRIANHTARISGLRALGHVIDCREWIEKRWWFKVKCAEYTYKGHSLVFPKKKEKKYTEADIIKAFNAWIEAKAPNAEAYLQTI